MVFMFANRLGWVFGLGVSVWISLEAIAVVTLHPRIANVVLASDDTVAQKPVYRVGVMAIRGIEQAEKQWQPTIDYLNQAIPSCYFELVALEFDTIEAIVRDQQIDFVLPNPGMYVELEWVYGARRIATLENLRLGEPYTEFGAVIFHRADRTDIQNIPDLKGKRFMAVSEIAFGGWQMAWATLKEAGINPYQHFQSLAFGGSHDNVVYAVRDGVVDAGTVRTDTLERMEQEGKINRQDFAILNQQTQHGDAFPFALSTELYPEWPFAAFPHTPAALSEKVAIALITIPPEHPAAESGQYQGWTIPANYQPVHETLRELKVRPYEHWGEVSLGQVFYQYRYWLVFTAAALAGLGYGGVRLDTRRRIEANLRHANAELENRVKARTAELQDAKDAAEAASRFKSEFLSSMSHELRTPLNAILGFAQVMLRNLSLHKTELPHEHIQTQRETLSIIHRSGEHLLSLINDVLDMSKIEAGRITVQSEPFDLQVMLAALVEMLHLRADNKGIGLRYECSSQVPQWVHGDERKLRQVLINLVGNAIKFTEEGEVTLQVEASELTTTAPSDTPSYAVKFDVIDTGVGIATDELANLFDPFVQTRSGQRSHEGTGLGLPISQKFVELMGGELRVESTLGIGSCFQFQIPLMAATPQVTSNVHNARRVTGLASAQPIYRILVVDDRPENRQLLVHFLQPLGFEVYEAENGREAITLWKRHNPHLVWMDIRMPVMNGYEATKTIKSQPKGKDTIIIALTASVFEDERSNILRAGCDDFVRKPISEEQLLDKLAEHLGVHYLYQDEPLPTNQKPQPMALEPINLVDLPQEWVAQLHLAARGADDELIWQLLDQIPASQSALAETLAEMVHNFRLDKIVSLTKAIPESSQERQIAKIAPGQSQYRILVVDDRPDNRRLLTALLCPLGFEVIEAENGHQAIDLWQQRSPQIILMDLRMPEMDGYTATRYIKAQPQGYHTTIIALTASLSENDKTSIFEAGFDDLMRKPFSEHQLLDNLAQYLGVTYVYQDIATTASTAIS